MKLRREARSLKAKAVSSLRRGVSAYNSYDEDGRTTTVLLHLQHACEMLIKAALVQRNVAVFDRKSGRSLGFEKCVNLARQHCPIPEGAAGVMRAIASLRDAEQHWLLVVEEDILYLHIRALVTAIDDILKEVFEDALSAHLPDRVLPVSTTPPRNIDFLIDREFAKIAELLTPGRRQRDEARGRIRTLLAMESHVVDEVAVSEKDISRIERAIRGGKAVGEVFPRLSTVMTETAGEGISIMVHFAKKRGAPVRFVAGDDPEEAGAVRELDLQRRFHMQAAELAKRVGLTQPKAAALRQHLKIDDDRQCTHTFEFGKTRIRSYSDTAVQWMTEALEEEPINEIWKAYQTRHRAKRHRNVS